MWPLRGFFNRALTTTPSPVNLIHRYEALLTEGVLTRDAAQLAALDRLQALLQDLHGYGGALLSWETHRDVYTVKHAAVEPQIRRETEAAERRRREVETGLFSRVFNSLKGVEPREEAVNRAAVEHAVSQRLEEMLGPAPVPPTAPRGVYLHGGVGSGKTLLADMFFAAAGESPTALRNRRRLHCNEALLELHSRIHGLEAAATAAAASSDPAKHARLARMVQRRLARERLVTSTDEFERTLAASNSRVMLRAARGLLRGDNAVEAVPAGPSSAGAALLCFDEMQTTDPFNVAALKALTEAALADGGTLVATSNRAPRQLSAHGLHNAMFEHFVGTLEGGCDIVEVTTGVDYRRQHEVLDNFSSSAASSYFYPLNDASAASLEAAWAALPGALDPAPAPVPVMFGRSLAVPQRRGGAAWLDFPDLCARPLGPADYVALAAAFHTVFISNVPALSMKTRDQARRFITLVDEVYNRRGRLVLSAAVPLDELFCAEGEEPLVDLEGLQFEGAVEGGGLRRDVAAAGGVAPVVASRERVGALGGEEERFAFARAVSRLHEMQSPVGAYARMHEAVWKVGWWSPSS